MSHPHYNPRHGGGRQGSGGGFRRDFRGPRDGENPNRRSGDSAQASAHVSVQKDLKTLLGGDRFPECDSVSLRLDKYVSIGSKLKLREIQDAVSLHNRRKPTVETFVPGPSFEPFVASLRSNLIVNQAGGILENAGISLHPHFNVPFLPGSAVKGIARHAAWLEWNEENDESKKRGIADRIARTFGYPTGDARPKKEEDATRGEPDKYLDDYLATRGWKDKASSGSVAFMAAFPCDAAGNPAPATLAVDILTPHGGNDWTDPVPNPFPVVAKKNSFKFSVGPVGPAGGDCVPDALRWLKKGLAEEGIGAKTAAGYGAFRMEGEPIPASTKSYTLRLVSPAFLRGAEGDEGKLREASLRGVLRYWWRILFGSVLGKAELAKLETFIWGGTGDSPTASQIAIRLVQQADSSAVLFDKTQLLKHVPQPFRVRRFDKKAGRDVETVPGLAYASYGMDDGGKRRKVLLPGAEWRLGVSFRTRGNTSCDALALHFDLALKALCTYGGVGAKSRKGFGSLDCGMPLETDQAALQTTLVAALEPFGFASKRMAGAYSLLTGNALHVDVATGNIWAVADRIGHALQTTASSLKHDNRKAAAGLPRNIHGPLRDHPLGHQHGKWTPRQALRPEGGTLPSSTPRFASPLFVHIAPGPDGMLKVNAIAFPSGLVRPVAVSAEILRKYLDDLETTLHKTQWK